MGQQRDARVCPGGPGSSAAAGPGMAGTEGHDPQVCSRCGGGLAVPSAGWAQAAGAPSPFLPRSQHCALPSCAPGQCGPGPRAWHPPWCPDLSRPGLHLPVCLFSLVRPPLHPRACPGSWGPCSVLSFLGPSGAPDTVTTSSSQDPPTPRPGDAPPPCVHLSSGSSAGFTSASSGISPTLAPLGPQPPSGLSQTCQVTWHLPAWPEPHRRTLLSSCPWAD